ncbi:uncharacterized protein [Paramormyrops kingsleyae]|uniref:uncharacterized protein n=1 Tax=Paramormyrops kingsleyae TaxID=1676925 RepID=UPI003B96C4C9
MPGGIKVLTTNTPEAVEAASVSLELYNQQGKDIYMYCLKRVNSARMQVVAGLKYYLDVETFRCIEEEIYLQRDNAQTFLCKFELLQVPWQNISRLLKGQCGEPIPVVGQITPVAAKDPLVQSVAKFAVNQYNVYPGNDYTYGMVQVLAAKKQLISGHKYYLDVWMAECLKQRVTETIPCTTNVSAQEFACFFVVWLKPGELGGVEFLDSTCIPFGINLGTGLSRLRSA